MKVELTESELTILIGALACAENKWGEDLAIKRKLEKIKARVDLHQKMHAILKEKLRHA